ncbi:MAG: ferrous iron transport protein B [Myxococcales bacterium]|nr:ferrous iron transport protein B [Myxococcales bacterium]
MSASAAPARTTDLLRIALAGNPNVGKTALFNRLTGARARVANYPGTTVERRTAALRLERGPAELVDVPGCHSLVARSRDEEVAHDVLTGRLGGARADLIIVVIDATHLQKGLYLALQLLELERPVVLALNQVDAARAAGLEVDAALLSQRLGVPAVAVSAMTGEGIPALLAAIEAGGGIPSVLATLSDLDLQVLENAQRVLRASGHDGSRGEAAYLLTSAPSARASLHEDLADQLDRLVATAATRGPETLGRRLIAARYAFIDPIAAGVIRAVGPAVPDRSGRIDRVVTNPAVGLLLFALATIGLFQLVYTGSEPLIGGVEAGIGWLQGWLGAKLPEGALHELVLDGLIAGVGNVAVFLPQLIILFTAIALLEDSGYMARAAFLLDRPMSRVGLHGKAFLPLMTSFACAIPGISAARTVEQPRDRLVTMLIAPFMSCSARLPIYTLVISALFASAQPVFGLSAGGLIMAAMYLLGILAAFFTAWLLKRTVLAAPAPPLVLELPDYRIPSVRGVLMHVWSQSRAFITESGPVIVALSIVLWAAMSYPKSELGDTAKTIVEQTARLIAADAVEPMSEDEVSAAVLAAVSHAEGQHRLQHSVAGKLGHAIEPIIAPLGFDWKIGIGLIGSFAAREVLVSTLGQVYGVGADEGEESPVLRDALLRETNPATGQPRFTPLVGVSLMVFFVLAMQCLSTVAALRRETGGWQWPLASIVYMNALAWLASLATFQIGTLLGFS